MNGESALENQCRIGMDNLPRRSLKSDSYPAAVVLRQSSLATGGQERKTNDGEVPAGCGVVADLQIDLPEGFVCKLSAWMGSRLGL
jgi:hypothetical protein